MQSGPRRNVPICATEAFDYAILLLHMHLCILAWAFKYIRAFAQMSVSAVLHTIRRVPAHIKACAEALVNAQTYAYFQACTRMLPYVHAYLHLFALSFNGMRRDVQVYLRAHATDPLRYINLIPRIYYRCIAMLELVRVFINNMRV